MSPALDREITACLSISGNQSERACAIQRAFRVESNHSNSPVASMFLEMSTTGSADSEGVHECEHRDEAVTAILSANFRSDLTSRYDLEFKNGIDMQDAAHCTYLKQSLDDMCNRLLDSLDRTEAALAKEPDPLNDEIKLHLAFAKLRAERFSPTGSSSAALDRAKVFTRQAGGRACVVHGPSGAGKTYVVAKLAVDLSSESKTCVVRFLGTSGDTADVGSLLRSVCQQLRAISMGKEAFVSDAAVSSKALPPCPSAYDDLVKYFFDSIKRWSWGPVVIILESLDQLSDVLGGRLLNWLLVDGFSGEVHIVCSTLPDEPNPEVGRPFRCLSILKKRIQDEQLFIEVTALKDSAQLIAHLLKLKCRRVTEGQLAALVETMERAQTPLMATLITDKASQWKSNEAAPEELPSSVRGIILEFFRDLVSYFQKLEKSKQAGERLVKHALSYITLVSKGIADTELQEMLSQESPSTTMCLQTLIGGGSRPIGSCRLRRCSCCCACLHHTSVAGGKPSAGISPCGITGSCGRRQRRTIWRMRNFGPPFIGSCPNFSAEGFLVDASRAANRFAFGWASATRKLRMAWTAMCESSRLCSRVRVPFTQARL